MKLYINPMHRIYYTINQIIFPYSGNHFVTRRNITLTNDTDEQRWSEYRHEGVHQFTNWLIN